MRVFASPASDSAISWLRLAAFLIIATTAANAAPRVKDLDTASFERERALLLRLERIESDRGVFSMAAIQPLLDLGLLYINNDRCEDAIAPLDRAVKVSHMAEGLFNPGQVQLLEPLIGCHLALDFQGDFQRDLEYLQLIAEQTYGPSNPDILPMLRRIANWYEEGDRYISARQLYSRAVDIARKAGGENDLRMVDPLRGIAHAFRLEYVHGLHPADDELNRGSPFRSRAELDSSNKRLDLLGETSLKRAVRVLQAHANQDRSELIDALLDLGDWYQMGEMRRDALRIYGEAWKESVAAGTPILTTPEPILFRTELGIALRRPPPDREGYNRYWADLDFTVDREGRVAHVKIGETNAPKSLQWRLVDGFAATRYRPRFEAGEPVDTTHLRYRQGMWVEKWKWRTNLQ